MSWKTIIDNETLQETKVFNLIQIHRNNQVFSTSLCGIKNFTNIPYIASLEFKNFTLMRKIGRKTKGLRMDPEHSWLSVYFQKEILKPTCPNVSLRWIDEEIGWGVFAERDFQALEFIAEYAGLVRKRVRQDRKNAYCFEYPLEPGENSPYVIDAQDVGSLSRYVNHSDRPNLTSKSVHAEGFNHIILYTLQKIPKGTELRYDYGPGYWQARPKPK